MNRRLIPLRLILPRHVLAELETEAKRQNISVSMLVRKVLEGYLCMPRTVSMRLGGKTVQLKLSKVNPDQPLVEMTAEEIRDVHEAMRIFREEDR